MNSPASGIGEPDVPESGSKAKLYRHKANGLRALAEIMERSSSRVELLAEAIRWERLAKAVEEAEQHNSAGPGADSVDPLKH